MELIRIRFEFSIYIHLSLFGLQLERQ
jgi:hypothetical protein